MFGREPRWKRLPVLTQLIKARDSSRAVSRLVLIAALLAVSSQVVITPAAAASPLSFAPPAPVGDLDAGDVEVANLDNDALPDLVGIVLDPPSVAVALGDGSGGFSASARFPIEAFPNELDVGDFNGDGRADVVTAHKGGIVSLLLGDGAGGLASATNYAVRGEPNEVEVGHFNRDSLLDVAVSSRNFGAGAAPGRVLVLLGVASGGFGPAKIVATSDTANVNGMAASDLNRDGVDDLVVVALRRNMVSALVLNSGGGVRLRTDYFVGDGPGYVVLDDYNQDGQTDAAVASVRSRLTVLLGLGTGKFGQRIVGSVAESHLELRSSDLNGDGVVDLATPTGSTGTALVLLGDGTGRFGMPSEFQAGGKFASCLAVGDFNADDRPDLAVCVLRENDTFVLLNTT